MPSTITALTLDLDDTLWPVAPVIECAERALTDWFATNAPEVLAVHDAAALDAVRRRVFADHPHLLHDFSALRRIAIARLLAAAGYDERLADAAFEAFFAARHAVTLFDDVVPALERLAARYPLVAVTNGNAELGRLPIGRHFRETVFARVVGRPKPDRAMFDAAAASLRRPADQILHVGDDLEHDVFGASEAGFHAIWINRTGMTDRRNVSSVTNLAELADQLGC